MSNKHASCRIGMPKWFEKILKDNPGENSLKAQPLTDEALKLCSKQYIIACRCV